MHKPLGDTCGRLAVSPHAWPVLSSPGIYPTCCVLGAEGAAAQGPGGQAEGGSGCCANRQACSCYLGGQLCPVPVCSQGLRSDTRLRA